MLARNVTRENLEQAADSVGINVIDFRPAGKTGARFRLSPRRLRTPAGRISKADTGRLCAVRGFRSDGIRKRTSSVCWHGHRDFFRALFTLRPDARVQTTLLARENRFNLYHGDLTSGARWYTAANFETVFPLTADLNIGSTYEPLYISEACECVDVPEAQGMLAHARIAELDEAIKAGRRS